MAENIVGKNARTQAESIPKDTKFVSDTLKGLLFNNLVNGGSRGRGGSGGNAGGGRPKSMQEYHNEDVRAQHDHERQIGLEGARHEQALSGLRAVHEIAPEGRVAKQYKYKGLEASYENAPPPPAAAGVAAGQAEGQQQTGTKKPKTPRKRAARKPIQFDVYNGKTREQYGVAVRSGSKPVFPDDKPATPRKPRAATGTEAKAVVDRVQQQNPDFTITPATPVATPRKPRPKPAKATPKSKAPAKAKTAKVAPKKYKPRGKKA